MPQKQTLAEELDIAERLRSSRRFTEVVIVSPRDKERGDSISDVLGRPADRTRERT